MEERDEDPDTVGLPEGLGEDVILEVERLERVPLTEDVEETVMDGDRDADLVRERVTVPVKE